MAHRGPLLLLLVVPAACAWGADGGYDGPLDAPGQAPRPYVSPPPRAFPDPPPETFVVVPDDHRFRDAQPPRVSTEEPQVLIRTFDPELGVYRDAEVRDREGNRDGAIDCEVEDCAQ
ncbi:hypothetical protein [Metapseudomonas furukawaii]|jgi:hypothetical protein|uniref:Lipoprotein n=1 Tax=Metapseudomonas furukawaii TaxID=1149133 RepID=A0AAD1FEF5_METFU|nr:MULTISPECIES: hypothetical protein [Pseudomonas]ELS27640.1 hypothetical protein ppKF707_4747 [Pseudomonas furukawaii]OWJ94568.1 hypothetical protein B6S59_13695 [Pseudomonas sp. A46]WAG80501.1 hypothetical protein LMK08_07480 [Pseudomonas furukawaii]BAU73181.1 hypothetical protein KF707C_14930 [Pseudomonas furukawaii]